VNAALEALRRIDDEGWLVGGAVRDRLLGRTTGDYDVVVRGDPERAARAIGRAANGHPFPLSEAFGAWRVVARAGDWQVDVTQLAGSEIEDDLRRRDFTINAFAEPLRGGDTVDPLAGRDDLAARRLRMVSPEAFAEDPLRTLRLARLACELDFVAEPRTIAAARQRSAAVAGCAAERVFGELKRVLAAPRAIAGLELMDAVAVTSVVLPELDALHGIEQSRFHHLDVHDHTMAVLAQAIELDRDPAPAFGEHAPAVRGLLDEQLADGLTRGEALRFGALLHDIAKPQTRAVTAEGRVTFIGHDELGAGTARDVLARLRASERLREHVAALTRHHLRLGFLVHRTPLDRRTVYDYLHATAPVQADVTVLSVADRLATRGEGSERAIDRHLQLARELIEDALAWRRAPPQPPVRGDELARALGIPAGPELGRLLEELEQASWTGEVAGREEAIERARELLGRLPRE
jgi:putative nucleotidyltransferase with HDIG domain